jgi:nicotinamide riboside kinase
MTTMKTFKEAVSALENSKLTLICGGESSGKTRAMGELVSELSINHTILVLSTHREIKLNALKSDNVEELYKPKDYKNVELRYLNTECEYIFIDEQCENVNEIRDGVNNKLVFIKTIKDKVSDIDREKFDLILVVNKDENGDILYEEIYQKTI